MIRPNLARILLIILPLWAAVGCSGLPPQSSGLLPPGSTYVFHFPGVAGDSAFDRRWTQALIDGGATHRVEICDWTCHHHWLNALYAVSRHRSEAERIAGLIAARRAADPTGKIMITSESAGAGIVLWTLERLPRGVTVDDVILVSPAVSSDFDLSAALAHIRGKMYYFDSPVDVLTLFLGTGIFGTIDQKRAAGAGLVGFHPPAHADFAAYDKLVEVKYDISWSRWGYLGTHLSGMSSAFARNVIAPILVRDEQAIAAAEAKNAAPVIIDARNVAAAPAPPAHNDAAVAARQSSSIQSTWVGEAPAEPHLLR